MQHKPLPGFARYKALISRETPELYRSSTGVKSPKNGSIKPKPEYRSLFSKSNIQKSILTYVCRRGRRVHKKGFWNSGTPKMHETQLPDYWRTQFGNSGNSGNFVGMKGVS